MELNLKTEPGSEKSSFKLCSTASRRTPELQVAALSSSLSTEEAIFALQVPVEKNVTPIRMTLESACEQSWGATEICRFSSPIAKAETGIGNVSLTFHRKL